MQPLHKILCATATAAALAAPASANAEPAVAITGQHNLVTLDTATPESVAVRPIAGLQTSSETVLGLDVRPSTGQLYAVTVPSGIAGGALVRTYTLDSKTATATFVGSGQNLASTTGDHPTGLDINPVADRIRVVQSTGSNFRINPATGSLAATDLALSFTAPATGPVTAAAYDRNVTPQPPATTLYEIDAGADRLVKQGAIDGAPSANGGVVSDVGPLGVKVDDTSGAGFDVSSSGTAYATLATTGTFGLYTVDLQTGAATLVGSTPFELRALAVLRPDPPQPPPPAPDRTPPAVTLQALPSKIAYAKFVKGLKVRLAVDEPAGVEVALSGRARASTGLAKVGDLTLAERGLILTPGKSVTTLKPKRKLLGSRKRFTVRLRIVAVDAAGNRGSVTRSIRVR